MALFGDTLCLVEQERERHLLRCIPGRGEELAASRADDRASGERLCQHRTRYLTEHSRAKVEAAERSVRGKVARLILDLWLQVAAEARSLKLTVNQQTLDEVSRLVGCYVLKTDLPHSAASTTVVHGRYKDLALVEQAFRTSKTVNLEA